MTGFAIVSTTVETKEDAKNLARALVEAKLAACVQILPIDSVYRWEGAIEETEEHLLLCKVAAASFKAVERAIREHHTYDVPEIVMTSVLDASPAYAAWLTASTLRGT